MGSTADFRDFKKLRKQKSHSDVLLAPLALQFDPAIQRLSLSSFSGCVLFQMNKWQSNSQQSSVVLGRTRRGTTPMSPQQTRHQFFPCPLGGNTTRLGGTPKVVISLVVFPFKHTPYCGWTTSCTLKPWLKPFFVGM